MFDKIKKWKDYKKVNEFFNYYAKNEFNKQEDKVDLNALHSINTFIDVFSQRIIENKIPINNTIEILNSFFLFDDDELAINVIASVLDKVYKEDIFINNYNNVYFRFPILSELSEMQFNLLIPVFIKIINYRINKLSIDILSWVKHNIYIDVILEQQYIDQLINDMNEKIEKINNVFEDKNNIEDKFILTYYLKFLELSEYIYDDKTIKLLKNINIKKMPHNIKLRVIDSMIIKNITIPSDVIEMMFEDKRNGFSTLVLLEQLKANHLIPKNIKLTQEDIALFRMEEWLISYSGWCCEPNELKIIDYFDENEHRYYIFSFKDSNSDEKEKVMLGISQGYEVGILKSYGIGEDYSQFDEIEEDYIKQAKQLLNELNDLLN